MSMCAKGRHGGRHHQGGKGRSEQTSGTRGHQEGGAARTPTACATRDKEPPTERQPARGKGHRSQDGGRQGGERAEGERQRRPKGSKTGRTVSGSEEGARARATGRSGQRRRAGASTRPMNREHGTVRRGQAHRQRSPAERMPGRGHVKRGLAERTYICLVLGNSETRRRSAGEPEGGGGKSRSRQTEDGRARAISLVTLYGEDAESSMDWVWGKEIGRGMERGSRAREGSRKAGRGKGTGRGAQQNHSRPASGRRGSDRNHARQRAASKRKGGKGRGRQVSMLSLYYVCVRELGFC